MAVLDAGGRALPEGAVKNFGQALDGTLLTPSDVGYDEAKAVWNGMIDRSPGLIAQCAGTADVVRAVNFGRDHELLIAVRGGGHSAAGLSVCDGGLMIDLSPMKGIAVDPAAKRARAQAGLLWSEFDRATQALGLATTGGMVSHTGIAGLTLGSGFGWLMRHFGLTPDNVISFELVTADGVSQIVSVAENPDLFWGLRGGGGNFGVVTSFEYGLHPLGPVIGGLVAYPLAEAGPVVRGWREYTHEVADELTSGVLFATTPDGHAAVTVPLCYSGGLATGESVVAPLRRLGTVAVDQAGPMGYVDVQSMFDVPTAPGQRYYLRASFLDDVSDDFVAVLAERYAACPSPMSIILLLHFGGAVSRVEPTAMAFPHRRSPYYMNVLSVWTDPGDDDDNLRWLRDTWTAIGSFVASGVDVNHIDRDEDRVREAYGDANYQRLRALKRIYDPDNRFRLNQNIKP